ncbi:MAG: hypothetical protein JSS04_13560 [Proteobacteria bacterium]|nr:hypothetical protein [Pseudomonadota bacterium]
MFKTVLAVALSWMLLSTAALAETGLERFEREVKPQIQLETFTYKSAEALGNDGFVLHDVVAVMPANHATGDKDRTLKVDKVTVEALDFERVNGNTDDAPRFAKLRLEGMTGDEDTAALLDAYGIPRVPMDIALDYRLDSATKIFTLNTLEIALRGQGKLSLSLVIDGVSDKTSEAADAKDNGRLRTASLTLDDHGLLAKLLPAIAKEQGQNAEGMTALALISIAAFTEGQGAPTLKALDSVASFIGDWQTPKGPLVLALAPARTASMADLDKVMQPNALVDIFGLTASYPGSREGAAKAGAAVK